MAQGDMHIYGSALAKFLTGDIDANSDTLKAAMVDNGYTFDITHDFFDDVSADELSGTNYTAGGVTLTSVTAAFTAANSWGTARANSTAYVVGDVVRPATGNGYLYRCVVAGTSGGSLPTYSTVMGATFSDGTVTWQVWGRGVTVLDCADPAWTSVDAGTPAYVIFYKSTGTASTSPLISAMENTTPTNGGNYTITINTNGLLMVAIQ